MPEPAPTTSSERDAAPGEDLVDALKDSGVLVTLGITEDDLDGARDDTDLFETLRSPTSC